MKRYGSAEWHGGLKDGQGTISTESETLNHIPYSFKTRFEDKKGTNPEELIGAAHAGCFSMAFAAELEKAGFKPQSVKTTSNVTLEKLDDGFAITAIHLSVTANIPSIDKTQFNEIANKAKEGCPISKLMKAKITMDVTLGAM